MNYKAMMEIKPEHLDEEWLKQPALLMETMEMAIEARIACDEARDRLDVVRAEVDKDVRMFPQKYGVEKVTETVVQNAVILSDRVKTAEHEYLTTRHTQLLTQGAVDALEHRKKALENITQLTLSGWRGEPKAPAGAVGSEHPATKAVSSAIRRRMN